MSNSDTQINCKNSHINFGSICSFNDFCKELKHHYDNTSHVDIPKQFTLCGTVKLHGTHADIIFTKKEHLINCESMSQVSCDSEITIQSQIEPTNKSQIKLITQTNIKNDEYDIQYQSRNRVLTLQDDNCGFVKFMESISLQDKMSLLHQFEKTYISHGSQYGVLKTVMIAGEFCGQNIQKTVAISNLPRMFVIFAVKINNVWQDLSLYKDVHLEDSKIYNIYRAPTYKLQLDYNNMDAIRPELQQITDTVDKVCPFANTFGIVGIGEGIVWTCKELQSCSRFWFKVKGAQHTASKVKTLNIKTPREQLALKNVLYFVEQAVTQARLDQGLDYLREMNIEINIKNIRQYIKWVISDTFKEESDSISDLNLNIASIKSHISARAYKWYKDHLLTL